MLKIKILDKTESICPECLKEGKINKIPAEIIEEDKKVYIRKKCKKHGSFKDIIFSDVKLYKKWIKYKVSGDGVDNIEIKSWDSPLEKLYPKHLSQSVLTNIMLTNRCNLRCSYCFMNAGASGYIYEPTLEQLRKMMEQVRNEKPVPSKAVQLTGGEPTVREDLIEIIKMAKELGFVHVQLNTNGIKLSEDVELCRKIKEAGVNTIYMSFDGISKETNPWIEQNKKAVENLRKAGLKSIVLVPVVMKKNLHELSDIIKYAIENNDVVRGVNFQPISFAGRLENVTQEYVKKNRVDYVEMIRALEEGLDGQINQDDFYPVPFVYPISKLVETLKGEKQVEFTANPICGGATYIFVENGKIIPITRFVDVEGFMKLVDKLSKESGRLKKVKIAAYLIKNINKYIDKEKAPKGFNITNILVNALTRGDYSSLGEFAYKSLYIGSMWFQDPWDMNLSRLKRCVIHYSTLDGVIPFCAYNGLGLGEKIRKKYSIPIKEWEKRMNKKMNDDLWKNGPIS
ncbi:MAG: radical SAM protein [Candidatus Aenigmarchaeota archaeon]|nr:radical SAM protein [Candidatus Aenigmarchaeota archaeon]